MSCEGYINFHGSPLYRLRDLWYLLMEIVIFGLAVLALLRLDRPDLTLILALMVIINIGLTFPLKQRPQASQQVA